MDILYQAIEEKNPNQLKLLIDLGYNIFKIEDKGASLLHFAADMNCESCAQVLIDNGIDVDVKDSRGCTPLIWAAYYDSLEVGIILIKAGANINYQTHILDDNVNNLSGEYQETSGDTPLIIASYIGSYKLVELLLRYGANTEIRNGMGENAFDIAKKRGNKKILRLLNR